MAMLASSRLVSTASSARPNDLWQRALDRLGDDVRGSLILQNTSRRDVLFQCTEPQKTGSSCVYANAGDLRSPMAKKSSFGTYSIRSLPGSTDSKVSATLPCNVTRSMLRCPGCCKISLERRCERTARLRFDGGGTRSHLATHCSFRRLRRHLLSTAFDLSC